MTKLPKDHWMPGLQIKRAAVLKAIRDYDQGKRPFKFTQPKAWFLESPTGELYPLKYLYAMVINSPPGSFNTSTPLSEFPKWGFNTVRQPRDFHEDFLKKVIASMKDAKGRADRLRRAPPFPKTRIVQLAIYLRNPDVVAQVLSEAEGVCGLCNQNAPFIRNKDQTPYLEVHHVERLADGGMDTVENSIAVCPNCHRKAHYG